MISKLEPSTYSVKMIIQFKDKNSILLNTMFHASNIPRQACRLLSCHNLPSLNPTPPVKTIEQHIVHSVWRTIQTTREKHRIAGIPTYLQDTVDQVLGQPLLPANPTSMQNVPELQLKVVPHHSFQQDLDKQIPDMPMAVAMSVGNAIICTTTAEINTNLPVVHLNISDKHSKDEIIGAGVAGGVAAGGAIDSAIGFADGGLLTAMGADIGKTLATAMGTLLTEDNNTSPDRIRHFGDPISFMGS